ncbi:MAG: oxidoreductase, partial [Ilumatobacteraceae bacterium]
MGSSPNAVTTHNTFCRVCHASCPLEVDVQMGRVSAVRGIPEDPLFGGYTCIKGRQLPDQISHPARLLATQRRRPDGTFESVASSSALDDIGARLTAIVQKYGPNA